MLKEKTYLLSRGLALLLWAPALSPAWAGELALVTGKVVHGNYAIEDAEVTAVGATGTAATTRSGYHGSFLLRLTPGTYNLKATGLIKPGVTAEGSLKSFTVPPEATRIDRLLIAIDLPFSIENASPNSHSNGGESTGK